jgi:hypothetical protein
VTIGVVTVAVGDTYLDRLPMWATAVAQLHRKPELVTVVTDQMPRRYVEILDDLLPQWQLVTSQRTWAHHPQVLVNDAIAMTETDWICKMDVDDIIFPHALTPLDETESNVWMFGIRHLDRELHPQPVTAQHIIDSPHNLVFSGSPYQRNLWIDNPYRDMIFEDWAFWIGCAQQDAHFQPSQQIDYEYTVHDQQISTRHDHNYWTQKVRELA